VVQAGESSAPCPSGAELTHHPLPTLSRKGEGLDRPVRLVLQFRSQPRPLRAVRAPHGGLAVAASGPTANLVGAGVQRHPWRSLSIRQHAGPSLGPSPERSPAFSVPSTSRSLAAVFCFRTRRSGRAGGCRSRRPCRHWSRVKLAVTSLLAAVTFSPSSGTRVGEPETKRIAGLGRTCIARSRRPPLAVMVHL